MDTSQTITHVSLCAGYGGIDLGLRRAIRNLRTIAVSEIEAFACANLVAKMEAGLLDPAPIWTDLKTFPWAEFRDRVDILSGGYPCPPFSCAGKRLGAEDPRHLWPFISAGIAAMRPAVCFFENVEGHISLGLRDVLQDLVGLGYRATWCVASASEVGAPHQRKRVFILAHRECEGLERFYNRNAPAEPTEYVGADAWASGECGAWPSRPGEQQFAWEPPRVVVDAKGQRANRRLDVCVAERRPGPALQPEPNDTGREGGAMGNATQRQDHGREPGDVGTAPSQGRCGDHAADGAGEELGNATHTNRRSRVSAEEAGAGPDDIRRRRSGESGEREIIKPMGLHLDGAPDGLGVAELSGLSDQELAEIRHWMVASDNRTDELRLLGNGVVPACAERAFRLLVGELMEHQP